MPLALLHDLCLWLILGSCPVDVAQRKRLIIGVYQCNYSQKKGGEVFTDPQKPVQFLLVSYSFQRELSCGYITRQEQSCKCNIFLMVALTVKLNVKCAESYTLEALKAVVQGNDVE
jgi:hypothetical protein